MRIVIIKDKYGVGNCFCVEKEIEEILMYVEEYCKTGEYKTQIQIKLQDVDEDKYNKLKEMAD